MLGQHWVITWAVAVVTAGALGAVLVFKSVGSTTKHSLQLTGSIHPGDSAGRAAGLAARKQQQAVFKALAENGLTDKVTAHSYHTLYGTTLQPLRLMHFNMLEIGLGCYMDGGAGGGIPVWKAFFPQATLYELEYNKVCADEFLLRSKFPRDRLLIGDQSSFDSLLTVLEKTRPLTLVIDDGGHTMRMQRLTLFVMFPALEPGGFHCVEDMETSRDEDRLKSYKDAGVRTSVSMMSAIVAALQGVRAAERFVDFVLPFVESVECQRQMCILRRNWKPPLTVEQIKARKRDIEGYVNG